MKYNIDKKAIGLYKYAVEEKIYYIGKSEDGTILDRLNSHEKEDKFQDILDKATIYVYPMKNKVEINAMEKLLINRYKPELNVRDAKEEDNGEFDFEEPKWIVCYDPNLLTIPEFINYRKDQICRCVKFIDDYVDNLITYLAFLKEIYKDFKHDDMFAYCCTNLDGIESLLKLSSITSISKTLPIFKECKIGNGRNEDYPYSVKIYLQNDILKYIEDKGADKVIKSLEKEIEKYSGYKKVVGNIEMMLDKISKSIESTGTWNDLEDAGWAFLRMLDLEKIAYIPEYDDTTEETREYFKHVKVDKEGRIITVDK